MSTEPADREASFIAALPDPNCTCRGCVMQTERDQARNERDLLRTEVERLAHLNGAIERVKALHFAGQLFQPLEPPTYVCSYDQQPWPCPTIQALEQP